MDHIVTEYRDSFSFHTIKNQVHTLNKKMKISAPNFEVKSDLNIKSEGLIRIEKLN